MRNNKVVIVGSFDKGSLEGSYKKAFEKSGYTVSEIDVNKIIKNYVPYGKIGNTVNTFIGIESWKKKGNREIIIEIEELKPEIILIFCNANITLGALAFLKSISTAKIGLIWPDTLFNLREEVTTCHKLYDFVGTYSSSSVSVFKALGFNNVFWLPLAADQFLHGIDTIPDAFVYDISFIGGWRPEREHVLGIVKANFPGLKMLIKGPQWMKRCKDKSLTSSINDGQAIGADFANYINSTKINLNIIDKTNYPAANMRFFEVPVCNGFQLSSACPEFETIFEDRIHMAYYHSDADLIEKIKTYHNLDKDVVNGMRKKLYELVLNEHTYIQRVSDLLKKIA